MDVGRRTHAEIVQDMDKSFKTSIHGHHFASTWGGRCEVSEMCEGIEEQERRGSCNDSGCGKERNPALNPKQPLKMNDIDIALAIKD